MIEQCNFCKNKETINGIIGCVYMDADCQNGEKYEAEIITNADRIRAMSDEELCDFLHKKTWLCESHHLCVDCPKYHIEKGCLSTDEWLKQPAEVSE